jgi:hypothetical protein
LEWLKRSDHGFKANGLAGDLSYMHHHIEQVAKVINTVMAIGRKAGLACCDATNGGDFCGDFFAADE